jgi:glyoxylase-like metal-dependent hydrolase (beta-lactamase superfamily II)
MKQATNAKVAAHELDADYIARTRSAPKPKNLMIKALTSVMKADPVDMDIKLKDNDKVGRLTVVFTPGHSIGSISLYDPERKVMFVGDAVRFIDGKVKGPPERFTLNPEQAKDSIAHLTTFDFYIMLSGHGQPLISKASKKAKESYATLK